jgi:hypothetical protein
VGGRRAGPGDASTTGDTVYRVRTQIIGGAGGSELSTHYFSIIGGLTAANANAAVGAFWLALKPYISQTLTMRTEAEVVEVDPLTGNATGAVAVTPVSNVGTATGNLCPNAAQGLVRWRTGTFVGGKEIRGRTFIPGPTVTHLGAGVPTSTYINAVSAAAAALIADANSDFMIYSRKNAEQVPALTGSCWEQFAILRSRRL